MKEVKFFIPEGGVICPYCGKLIKENHYHTKHHCKAKKEDEIKCKIDYLQNKMIEHKREYQKCRKELDKITKAR